MARRFDRKSPLMLASHNQGKLDEIRALITPLDIDVQTAAAHGLPEPEETGTDFHQNAALKARGATEASGMPALADDSGFCVVALGGAPGIYSARWAGETRDFDAAMRSVYEAWRECGSEDCTAYFVCVLALAWPDTHIEYFEGRVMGDLTWPPRGDKGFGYDPIFTPKRFTKTFAEFSPAEKDKISHRAAAFQKLKDQCLT